MTEESFIRVESKEGVWWLIEPEGRKFISIGLNHVDPLLMTGPYNVERTLNKYGQDFINSDGTLNFNSQGIKRWYDQVKKDFDDWNFNTFGYHNTLPSKTYSKDYYYIQPITLENVSYHYVDFPDVFSNRFQKDVENEVRQVCSLHKNEKNLIGYAFMDLPAFEAGNIELATTSANSRASRIFLKLLKQKQGFFKESPDLIHPIVNAYRSLPLGSAGKKEWIRILQTHYGDPETAANVYNLKLTSWKQLEETTEWPVSNQIKNTIRDSTEMLTSIYNQYYFLHYTLIKKYDPNHMILGDKLNGNKGIIDEFVFPILKKYVDIIFIESFSHFEKQVDLLKEIYEKTRKPILIGDASFSVLQSNQIYCRGIHCESQEQVGKNYYSFMKSLMSLPFMIGWHHCGYIEGHEGLRVENDPFCSMQCGFKDPFENVHIDAIQYVKQANSLAEFWHNQQPTLFT